jgi:NAD+ diphosphatase
MGDLNMEMRYCMHCGHKLDEKYLMGEGMVPYCPNCEEFRFPVYNTAVSMIVMNKELDRVLLIKQYGRDSYILVAGYVNKGEDAEDAVSREIKEEMGLKVLECHFNRSHYFAPSNTLMLNFTAIVEEQDADPNTEIDAYKWFSIEIRRSVFVAKFWKPIFYCVEICDCSVHIEVNCHFFFSSLSFFVSIL